MAANVLGNSRAQSLLANFGAVNNVDVAPMREFFATLLALPEVNRFITGMLSGVDIQYPMPGGPHPLLGKRLFDIRLSPERGALLDPTGALAPTARNWADRVEVRSGEWFGPGMATVTETPMSQLRQSR